MALFARFRSSHSFGGAGTICRSRPSYGIAGRCIRRQVVGGLFVVVRGHDPQSVVGLVGLRKLPLMRWCEVGSVRQKLLT